MRAFVIGSVLFVVACGGATPQPAGPPVPGGAAAGDQTAQGAQLYASKCAECHGDQGQGTKKAPPVVGKDALPLDPRPGQKRTAQFHTAADVFTFVKAKMPGDDPGSLSDADYLAILAFDLHANGVDLHGQPLDAASAGTIVLH
jgi:cytochrome c